MLREKADSCKMIRSVGNSEKHDQNIQHQGEQVDEVTDEDTLLASRSTTTHSSAIQ
jgi:hypothetical protein